MVRRCRRNASAIGIRTTAARAATAANSGLSARVSRTASPIAMSTALIQNGSRQPQARNCSSGSREARKNASVAAAVPAGAPIWGKAP